MKKIKIFTRMLLVVIMVFSLGATVFAEETDPSEQTGYTITINNAHNGETYTAYKLLSATYAEEDSTAIAYYYEGEATDELYTILATYFQFDAFVDGKAYVKVVDDDGAEISYADVDVAQLAEDLNAALTRAENPLVITAAGSDVAEGGKAEISVAEKGYYFIDTTLGSLCAIDTVKNVEMFEKNTFPTLYKGVKEDSDGKWYTDEPDDNIFTEEGFATADRNQEVEFKLVVVLGTNNNQNNGHNQDIDESTGIDHDYVITDTLNEYTTYVDGSFEIDGWTEGTDYTVVHENGVLTITLKASKLSTLEQGAQIEMTYSVTVDADAPAYTELTNTAKMEYTEANETTEVSATVKTYEFEIEKIDGKDDTVKLEGVKFTLTKTENGSTLYWNNAEWSAEEYEFVTDADGKITITGLDGDDESTYTLTETETLEGYNLLDAPITVTIDKDGVVKFDNAEISNHATQIENFSGTVLPSTGGIGTTIFYILGSIMMVCAGIFLVAKKRVRN